MFLFFFIFIYIIKSLTIIDRTEYRIKHIVTRYDIAYQPEKVYAEVLELRVSTLRKRQYLDLLNSATSQNRKHLFSFVQAFPNNALYDSRNYKPCQNKQYDRKL